MTTVKLQTALCFNSSRKSENNGGKTNFNMHIRSFSSSMEIQDLFFEISQKKKLFFLNNAMKMSIK